MLRPASLGVLMCVPRFPSCKSTSRSDLKKFLSLVLASYLSKSTINQVTDIRQSTKTNNRWKKADNIFRTKWDLKAIPTLVKYTRTGEGVSQNQVVEKDILNEGNLKALVQS